MWQIKKYQEGLAIHDLDNETSRLLTDQEAKAIQEEFPSLRDPKVVSYFTDVITSIKPGI